MGHDIPSNAGAMQDSESISNNFIDKQLAKAQANASLEIAGIMEYLKSKAYDEGDYSEADFIADINMILEWYSAKAKRFDKGLEISSYDGMSVFIAHAVTVEIPCITNLILQDCNKFGLQAAIAEYADEWKIVISFF